MSADVAKNTLYVLVGPDSDRIAVSKATLYVLVRPNGAGPPRRRRTGGEARINYTED